MKHDSTDSLLPIMSICVILGIMIVLGMVLYMAPNPMEGFAP